MKRCLAALFCCLLVAIPVALAEEPEITADWLVGVWRFDGGGEVCGYGFHLDADGTCTFFLTDDYENFPPERLIPCDIDAIWRYEDGKLITISESGMSAYPLEYYPDRSERSGSDTIHLEEGMSGGFYQRGEEHHVVKLASPVPMEVLEQLEAFHPEYQLEGYVEIPGTPQGDLAFSLIRCNHGRMLHGFRQEGGLWVNWLDNIKGIPQAEGLNVWLYAKPENAGYSQLWYSEYEHPFTAPEGPSVSVSTDNGETIEENVTYLIREDGLSLFSYGDHPNCQIDVVEGELVFYNISYGYDGKAKFDFPIDILSVDFYALPRNVQDVRITGTGEPNLPFPDTYNPLGEWDNFLEKQDVTLRAGKYPVYMGPGKQFGRAANGKAAVSTNGWVQVFGEYDGWLLIHYAVSAEQYRFGWIEDSAIVKGETVAELPLTFGDWMNNEEAIDLMDDPLNSRTSILHLPQWTQIEQLAQLGDGYSLVRVTVDGKVYWGFVFSWPLGHG